MSKVSIAEDSGRWSYEQRDHLAFDRAMPVLLKVIERRTCNGERLRVNEHGIRRVPGFGRRPWYCGSVVGADTGTPLGKRWIRRLDDGSWDVRSERP